MLEQSKVGGVDLSRQSISASCAAPYQITPAVYERLQMSHSTGISKDYLNKFAGVIALLQMTPEFLPREVTFPRVNEKLRAIPEYSEFVDGRFEQLKLAELQPGISPEHLMFFARPYLSSLSTVVATLKAVHLDIADSFETTHSKIGQIQKCVSQIQELVIPGSRSLAPIDLNQHGRAA